MTRRFILIFAAVTLFVSVGCSSDDTTVVVPPVDFYEAHGDFTNLLVGDGSVDTRMNVHLGSALNIANEILPNGTALDRGLLLAAPQETASIGISLFFGDGTVLNTGEQFPLTRDRSYVFMAVGHVSETQGVLKPTLLQLTPLASPGYGKVQFRFVHALAGNPIPVDVHVNGEIITNVAFGSASAAVTFDARSAGQDSLLVVPTGVTPDGSNEILKSTGHILFFMDTHFDAIMSHHPRSVFDGDVSGQAVLLLIPPHGS